MKPRIKNTLILIAFGVILGLVGYIHLQNKRNEKLRAETRAAKIKNDSLVKVKDGLYTKLVADSLTIKELRKIFKDLGIDEKNPVLAQKLVFVPSDTVTIIKEIQSTNTTLTFTDYYPRKENYFAKHITNLSTKDTTATGEFKWNPISVNLGINQQEDGTYKVTTKVPEFIEITSLDVQSNPLKLEKKDNFGVLLGLDYSTEFDGSRKGLVPNIYLRADKFYIGGGISTLGTGNIGFKIEL